MSLILGSTLSLGTVIAAIFICFKARRNLTLLAKHALLHIKYNHLATKELFVDLWYTRSAKVDLFVKPDKVVIVTGGSRGIGFRIAKMLLRCDMEVIIACRRPSAGEEAIKEIRKSGVTSGRAKVYKLDNCSLKSVREFAEQIKHDYKKIDILINNAGIMFTPYEETEDGYELQWGVNYLSHFLLTLLLIPLLNAGGSLKEKSRVVNVTSCAHLIGSINFCDVNSKDAFVSPAAYAQSKLAQVLFTQKLQKLLTQKSLCVEAFSVHPGLVNTEIFSDTYVGRFRWLTTCLFKTPEQGAIPVVYTALSENVEGQGGVYISNCMESTMHPLALDSLAQDRLWQLSLEQVQMQDFFSDKH